MIAKVRAYTRASSGVVQAAVGTGDSEFSYSFHGSVAGPRCAARGSASHSAIAFCTRCNRILLLRARGTATRLVSVQRKPSHSVQRKPSSNASPRIPHDA